MAKLIYKLVNQGLWGIQWYNYSSWGLDTNLQLRGLTFSNAWLIAGKKVFWDVRVIEVEEKGASGLGSMGMAQIC